MKHPALHTLRTALLLTALSGSAHAALVNGDFSSGLSGWSSLGDVAALHGATLSTASLAVDDAPAAAGAFNTSGVAAAAVGVPGGVEEFAGLGLGALDPDPANGIWAFEGSVLKQSLTVNAGDMLEHAEVFGNFYGSPKAPVERAMAEGRDTLFDIDWQGGQQVKQAMGSNVVSIFILPPSIAELERRLRSRGQDSDEVIAGRMAKSEAEISHWAEYDYVLINNDLDQAEADLITILKAERMRRDRQPGLSDFVRGLNKEFEAR